MKRKIIVDGFAGGGGASEGIRLALGRSPDYGYNHDIVALAMHCVNHPETRHFSSNIWKVDPDDIEGDIGIAWFSPDCKHFSKAKGAKPVERNIRDLAWVVVRWARRRAGGPEVIFLENVEEFITWGPLVNDRPCPERKGEEFRRWVKALQKLGYVVEWQNIIAADRGAPTLRKRLFVVARRDGKPIVWPPQTYASVKLKRTPSAPAVIKSLPSWRTAAEDVLDFSLPCPSIFDTSEEIFHKHGVRASRPLKPNTMARIARGIFRFVINHPEPFLIPLTHTGDSRVYSKDEPLRTATTANGGEFALISPHVTKFRGNSTGHDSRGPLHTVTANAFVKRPGGGPPMAVVTPFLAGVGSRAGQSVERTTEAPFGTTTATKRGQHALIAPTLIQTGYGERPGQAPRSLDLFDPLGTAVAGGCKHAVVAAFLAQHNGGEVGRDAREPVSTIVQVGPTQALVSAGLLNLHGTERRWAGPLSPTPTQCAGGGHAAHVAAFLVKYHETGGRDQHLRDPLHTQDTRGRFGLIKVTLDGDPCVAIEIEGQLWVFNDIGMRMLTPRELFRAQGFSDDYIIDRGLLNDWRRNEDGTWTQRPEKHVTISKTDQIRMCGNSVSPMVARDLVAANCPDMIEPQWMEAAE